MAEVPRIGVGVFVMRPDGHFIIGQRADKNSLGYGTWALPGGHLEFRESFDQCAARELLEETGISVGLWKYRYLTAVSTVFKEENKHYVTIFMGVMVDNDEEPKLLEPTKCSGWTWIQWQSLATQDRVYFAPLVELLRERYGCKESNWLSKEMAAQEEAAERQ